MANDKKLEVDKAKVDAASMKANADRIKARRKAEAEKIKKLVLASCDSKAGAKDLFKYKGAILKIMVSKPTTITARMSDDATEKCYPFRRDFAPGVEEDIPYWVFEQLVHREHRQSGSGHGRLTDENPLVITPLSVTNVNNMGLPPDPQEGLQAPGPDLPSA